MKSIRRELDLRLHNKGVQLANRLLAQHRINPMILQPLGLDISNSLAITLDRETKW